MFQITRLEEMYEKDAEQLRLSAEEEEMYIKTMSYVLTLEEKRQKQDVRAEYFAKLKENERKGQHLVHFLKGVLGNKLYNLTQDTIQFLDRYEHRTRNMRKTQAELKTQDNALQALLTSQLERIRKASEYLKVLKIKMHDSQKLLGSKLRDVQEDNNNFSRVFSILKDQLESDRKNDFQQIIHMTVNYNETINYLTELRDKVKSILLMNDVCTKLETEEEIIKPFPVCTLENVLRTETVKDFFTIEEFLPSLELFWQRVGQANACRYAINEEREYLRLENDVLKKKIYEYCQCIECPAPEKNILKKGIKHITEGVEEKKKYDKQKYSKFDSLYHFDIDE